jgi:hypothetical protein
MARIGIAAVALLLVVPQPGAQQLPRAPVTVRVSFRNVSLHMAPGVVLDVSRIDGAFVARQPNQPPIFDDERSYTLRIDSGEMSMTTESLSNLLNGYVFKYDGAALSDISVTIEEGRLKQKATLRKGVPIPFSMTAELSATPDGRMRVHPTSMKAIGIPATDVMKLFDVEVDELVKSNRAHGVEIVENDLLLSPSHLLPQPALDGHLTGVRIVGSRILQEFGGRKSVAIAPAGNQAKNYMYYRGGVLRFGKLTMNGADMQLIDADPRDAFDFYPSKYVAQLVAGYSKNTPGGGLRVYMPDYNQTAGANLRPPS